MIYSEPQIRIMQAASKEFLVYGYSKISMDEIASRLGMSKKTLYLHFAGKKELMSAIVDKYTADLSFAMEHIMQQPLEFKEKVQQIFATVGTHLSQITPFLLVDLCKNAPEVWAKIQQYKKETALVRFNQLLEEGIDKGVIKPTINKTLCILLYLNAIESLLSLDFMNQLPENMKVGLPGIPSEIFINIVQIIFEGVLI